MKFVVLTFLFLLISPGAFSQKKEKPQKKAVDVFNYPIKKPKVYKSYKLKNFRIKGFKRTKDHIIARELELKKGDIFSKLDLNLGYRRLENAQIFYDLKISAFGKNDEKTIEVSGKDRWTTIPILKFSSGGGVNQLIAGLYDPNIFGRFFELGGQYERLGDANSFVFWYKRPWIFGQRLFTDVQYWNINRVRTNYNVESDKLEEVNGFVLERQKFFLGLTKEISLNFKVGLTFDFQMDNFSEALLTDEIKFLNRQTNFTIDPTQTLLLGANVELGNIQFSQDYLVDGSVLKLEHRRGISVDGSSRMFHDNLLAIKYFKTLAFKSTVAFRGLLGSTNTEKFQYRYFLGGFDRVRGFVDNRLSARNYWLTNVEFRIPAFQNSWVVVQPTAFADIATISENFDSTLYSEISAGSVGGGARVIFPKIYRLVARFDYAYTFSGRKGEAPISFGVQQFF